MEPGPHFHPLPRHLPLQVPELFHGQLILFNGRCQLFLQISRTTLERFNLPAKDPIFTDQEGIFLPGLIKLHQEGLHPNLSRHHLLFDEGVLLVEGDQAGVVVVDLLAVLQGEGGL